MEWKHGVKSGAVAGVFYGIIAGIVTVLYMILNKEMLIERLQAVLSSNVNIPISTDQLYNITLISSFPSSIIGGVLVGVIFVFDFRGTKVFVGSTLFSLHHNHR